MRFTPALPVLPRRAPQRAGARVRPSRRGPRYGASRGNPALAQWQQQATTGGSSLTPFVLVGAVAGLNALSQRGPEGQTAYHTTTPNWLSQLAAGLGFTLGRGNKAASLGATSLEGWIKYRVLDNQGNQMLDAQGRDLAGVDYLAGTGQWEYLQTGVRVPDNGVIEVMAGTSGSGEAVYFDNLRVEQTGGLIVQEQHQYAYGAPLPGLSYVVGNRRYRYGYQGQYAEHDSLTGFESFELRLYNSRVGRWMSYDPEGQYDSPYVGMGNNPISGVDPDGAWSGPKLPKFRPPGGGLHAATGLSNLAKWGMRTGSSLLRTASSYLEKGDAWVHSDAGERAGQRFANLHPWIQFMNIVSAYKSGTDIYDNEMSEGQAREAMSALMFPGPPEGGMAEGLAAETGTARVITAQGAYSLTKHGELTNGIYTVSREAMKKHVFPTIPGKSLFYRTIKAEEAVLQAAEYADKHGLWVANKAKVPVLNTNVGVTGRGVPTNIINIYRNSNGTLHGAPGNVR